MKYLPFLFLLLGCAPEGKFGKPSENLGQNQAKVGISGNEELAKAEARIKELENKIYGLEKDLADKQNYNDIQLENINLKERVENLEITVENNNMFKQMLVEENYFETDAHVFDLYSKAFDRAQKERDFYKSQSETKK